MSQKPDPGKTSTRATGIRPPTASGIPARKTDATTAATRRSMAAPSPAVTPQPPSATTSRIAKEIPREKRPVVKEIPEVVEESKKIETIPVQEISSPTVKELAQQITKKNPSAPPPPVYQNVSEATEVELLRNENKDLNEKLETLRIKRQEDRAKLQHAEQIQLQLESQQKKNHKLGETLHDAQKKLAENEREVSELLAWRAANQETIHNHQNDLEMALLDKEMVEVKVDELTSKVEDLEQALELSKTELEILREEMRSTAGEGGGHNLNSIQLKSFEEQNDKLKQACIKLRDANSILASEKQENAKELSALRNENSELLRLLEITKQQANEANERMLDLQERVDANLDAVNMVEALTLKSMEAEDEKAALQRELEDYQAIHDMDQQLQETQKQTEKDLLQDVADRDIHIHELKKKLTEEGQHAAELVKIINKYKEKVAQLNEQIEDLKDQGLRYQEVLETTKGEDKKLAGVMSQLQSSQGKVFAQIVDASLKTIELDFARKQMDYIKAFLPDTFTKAGGDSDAVVLTVAFPRVQAKAQLLAKLVLEQYPGVPGGMRREHVLLSHKSEQWAHCQRIGSITSAITVICSKFESALEQCSMDVLAKIAHMQSEVVAEERTIDVYFDYLKQGRLDENTLLDSLSKVHAKFSNMFTLHLSGQPFDTCKWVEQSIAQITATIAWWSVNAQRVLFYLPEGDSDVREIVEKNQHQMEEFGRLLIGATRCIPKDKSLRLSPEFIDEVSSSIHCLDRICSVFSEATSMASNQIGISEAKGLDSSRLKEMLHAVVEKVHGSIALDKAFDPINRWIVMIGDAITDIKKKLESGAMEDAIEEKKIHSSPVIERAMLRRQAAVDAEGLKWQIEKKENEINELKRTLKARIDDLSNYKLRLEMAEKRVENSGKVEGVKAQHWEQKYEQLSADSKRREAELDQTIMNLNQEVETLHKDMSELHNRAKAMSRTALIQGVKSYAMPAAGSSSPSSFTPFAASSAEFVYMQQQVVDLQQQLRYATVDLRRLEAEKAALGSRSGNLRVPNEVYGRISLDHYAQKDSLEKQLKVVFDEAMKMKDDEVRLDWFQPNPIRGSEAEQRAEWRNERAIFETRANVLANRFVNLAREIGHTELEIDVLLLGFPRLTAEESTETMEDLCKKFGIPIGAK
ncbi:unnamed protein product, partial [Mesorhabditis belari]|uniref:Dynein associated protein domain-containing protein n=1 Tax=Mesorhabditis belari TaxID=2138241 RepID=A0AAF3EWD1_9BILA